MLEYYGSWGLPDHPVSAPSIAEEGQFATNGVLEYQNGVIRISDGADSDGYIDNITATSIRMSRDGITSNDDKSFWVGMYIHTPQDIKNIKELRALLVKNGQ